MRDEWFRLSGDVGFTVGVQALAASASAAIASAAATDTAGGVLSQPGLNSAVLSHTHTHTHTCAATHTYTHIFLNKSLCV